MNDLDYEINNLVPSLLRYIKRNFITVPFDTSNEMVLYFDEDTSLDFLRKLSNILTDKCFNIVPNYPYTMFLCSEGWTWYSNTGLWVKVLPTITISVSTFGEWKD